jgi:hypothetical protein
VPTPKEINEGKISPQNIERALYALHFDGLLVLENAVNHPHLDTLNETIVKNAVYITSLGDESPYNYRRGSCPIYEAKFIGNIQQDPTLRKDLFFRDVFLKSSPFFHFRERHGNEFDSNRNAIRAGNGTQLFLTPRTGKLFKINELAH